MLLVLIFLFGDPRAALFARVLAAMGALCPCPFDDGACEALHVQSALAITIVASDDADPESAAASLLGLGAIESGFRTDVQRLDDGREGPAVSVFQVEVHPRERATMRADPVRAARHALRMARMCGGSLRAYVRGNCHAGDENTERAAAIRRGAIRRARYMLNR